jgi:hypothetical protein
MIGYTTLRVAAHEFTGMAAGGSDNGSGGGGGDGRWLVEGTPRWLELRHPFGECDGLGCDLSAQVAACLSQVCTLCAPALPASPAPSAPSRTLYTFPHPLHPPAPSDTPPLPCPLSQGERSSALLLLVAAAASAGVYQLVCAARHALAAGRSRRERMRSAVACLVRALLLLAASVPVQRCEGDGGYGGGCADKDFEYDGFEVIHKAVASST